MSSDAHSHRESIERRRYRLVSAAQHRTVRRRSNVYQALELGGEGASSKKPAFRASGIIRNDVRNGGLPRSCCPEDTRHVQGQQLRGLKAGNGRRSRAWRSMMIGVVQPQSEGYSRLLFNCFARGG